MPTVLLPVTFLMFYKKKIKPDKSDERQKLILQTNRLEREKGVGLKTSPKLETLTHYVMSLGYTSYCAPKFWCRHFHLLSNFLILLKSSANLPTFGCWVLCVVLWFSVTELPKHTCPDLRER